MRRRRVINSKQKEKAGAGGEMRGRQDRGNSLLMEFRGTSVHVCVHVWSLGSPSVRSGQTLPDGKQHAEVVHLLTATILVQPKNRNDCCMTVSILNACLGGSRGQRRWLTHWLLMTRFFSHKCWQKTIVNWLHLNWVMLMWLKKKSFSPLAESFKDAWCRFWEFVSVHVCLSDFFFFFWVTRNTYICLFCE